MIRTTDRDTYGEDLTGPHRSSWSAGQSDGSRGTPRTVEDPWPPPLRRAREDPLDAAELIRSLAVGRGQLLLITGQRGAGRSRRAMATLDRARSVCDVVLLGHHGLVEGVVEADPMAATSFPPAPDGPGGTTSAPICLLRSVARIRPDGPAARLAAEISENQASGTDHLAEEVALVLVAEAVRRPLAVLLDDVHRADEVVLALVDHLLTVVDTVPLLLVATAATGAGTSSPHGRRWRGWVGRHGVTHVRILPLQRAELVHVLGQVCRSPLPEDVLDGLVKASRGNPRIAQEIALWMWEGARADEVPATFLVRELVAGLERDGILATVAIMGAPVEVRLIARVTSTSTTQVRRVLESARAAGVVDLHGEQLHSDTYTPAHPIFTAAARSLLPKDRAGALHLAISSVLIGEHVDEPAAAVDIARHLVASGHPRSDTPLWCLRAAVWCETGGRLRESTEFAQAGLDADPDLPTRVQLVAVLARAYRRLGEHRSAAGVLRVALRAAHGQPDHRVPLAVDLLELRDLTVVPDAEVLIREAKAACPPGRSDLLARLAAAEAAMTFRRDPVLGRRAASRAIRAAESADDTLARVRALDCAARMFMEPGQLGTLERLSSLLIQQPGVTGLATAAAAALAGADRGRLDFVLREYAWREGRESDQVTRDELTLLKGAVAALDGRKAVISQALLHLARTTTPQVALAASLLPALWTFNTRGTLRAPVPDVTGLPGAGSADELRWLSRLAVRTTPLHPAEVDLIKQRLGGPDRLLQLRQDGSGPARLAAAALFGAVSRDRELCDAAVHSLEAFAEQFLVLSPYLPIGPVGWYLAPALRVLGRRQASAAVLAAAQEASDGLGASGWSLRVAAERARLAASGAPVQVGDVVLRSIGPVAARRFPGVVAEIRCRLNQPSTDVDQFGGPADPGTTDPGTTDPGTADPGTADRPGGSMRSGPLLRSGPPMRSGPPEGDTEAQPGAAGLAERRVDVPALSQREADIMALAAIGCTNQEIAKQLFLSVATVERHCTNLYRRLGVRNRAQALGILGRLGPPDGP